MPKPSAGILMFRQYLIASAAISLPSKELVTTTDGVIEVLLVHPGGPFNAKKDVWSIPKGEYEPDENILGCACREFTEETGLEVIGLLLPLGDVKYSSNGKRVSCWALEGNCDASKCTSNTFEMEWPPKSGKMQKFPEVDKAEWFSLDVAKTKIQQDQKKFLERLVDVI